MKLFISLPPISLVNNAKISTMVLFLSFGIGFPLSAQFQCGYESLDDPAYNLFISNLSSSISSGTTTYSIPIHLVQVNPAAGVQPESYPLENFMASIDRINSAQYFDDITFYLCKHTIVDDPDYHGEPISGSIYNLISNQYYDSDKLNVYLFSAGTPQGFSLGVTLQSGVAISRASAEKTLAHEIGHWLGLRHTFESTVRNNFLTGEIEAYLKPDNSYNYFVDPNGDFCFCPSACSCTASSTGDMIADTEVDVFYDIDGLGNLCDFNAQGECIVTHVAPDGSEIQETYYPDQENIMSYYFGASEFSAGQQTRMGQVLLTHGAAIINNAGTGCTTFPTPSYLGVSEGFVYAPIYNEANDQYNYPPMENMWIEYEDPSITGFGGTDIQGSYVLDPNLILIPENKDIHVRQREFRTDDFYNASDEVSLLDLIRLQKHILGTDLIISPYDKIAGDVNNTGSITALDMIQIQKVILGIYLGFPETPIFRLVPRYALSSTSFETPFFQDPFNASWAIGTENRAYLEDLQTGDPSYLSEITINLLTSEAQDVDTWSFNAVKSGDTNNSFAMSLDENLIEDTTITQLTFGNDPHTCISANEVFQVVVSTDQFQDIEGFQTNLQLEGAYIRGVRSMDLAGFSTTNFSVSEENNISMVWVDPEMGSEISKERYAGQVDLFELTLVAEKPICNISSFFSDNSEALPSLFVFGGASEGGASTIDIDLDIVSSVKNLTATAPFPNPASSQVTIPFQLTESKSVELIMYDGFGFWYEDEGSFPVGTSSFVVNSNFSTLPNGTTVFYVLRADDEVVLGSLIKQ